MPHSHVLLILTLCGTAALTTCAPDPTPSAASSIPERQFTRHDAVERDAAWSPDGKSIIFGSVRSGNEDIWIKAADGGQARQLTTDPAQDLYAVWSPDGKSIAFSSDRNGEINIWIKPIDGGQARQLTSDADSLISVNGSIISWSPDGKSIAFAATQDGNRDIWTIAANGGDGGEKHRLTSDPASDQYPAWSPDGKFLCFTSNRSGNNDVWIAAANGSDAQQLTTHPAEDRTGAWSPDGQHIAFFSERGGDGDIWRMPITGGAAQQVTATPDRNEYVPRWSPDGRHISFNEVPGVGQYRSIATDGGEAAFLSDRRFLIGQTTFWSNLSVDDQWIAYIAVDSTGRHLWKRHINDDKPVQLTQNPIGEAQFPAVRWSPDGRRIAFAAAPAEEEVSEIWTIAADGGEPDQVTVGSPGGASIMDWSPDGRFLAFTMSSQDGADIWLTPVDGGVAHPLTSLTGIQWGPIWSPDGKTLVFTSDQGLADGATNARWHIWTIAADGGDATYLSAGFAPSWSPDGKTLVFARSPGTLALGNSIWTMPADGGLSRQVLEGGGIFWPRFSRDGRKITYLGTGGGGDIWIADLNGQEN